MFELKPLSRDGIAGALARGERYRLLNEPGAAESIYLDVLQIDPDNEQALVGLLLSLTDQFDHGLPECVSRAREVLPRLRDEYERAYYAGIICERRARAQLRQARPGSGTVAYESFREAMSWYEKAEPIRPPGNDDALLRWNACARQLMRHPHLQPAAEEPYVPHHD
jgi:hypothetical protein